MTEPLSPKPYSSFLGLQIFVSAFIVWLVFQVVLTYGQSAETSATVARLQAPARAALQEQHQLEVLVGDLQNATSFDSSATEILREYGLPEHPATPSTNAPPAP